jgi:hypothetical protein
MSSYQRTKGHNFERWVAQQLRPIFPDAARGFQTRGGTAEETDIKGTPYAIECKVGAQPNIRAAMAQVQAAQPDGTPVVVTKRDRECPLVTMRFEDWVALIGAVYGVRE